MSKLDRYGDGVQVAYVDGTTKISTVSRVLAGSSNVGHVDVRLHGQPHYVDQRFHRPTWLYSYNSAGRLISVTAPISSGSPLSLTQYSYYRRGQRRAGLAPVGHRPGRQRHAIQPTTSTAAASK